MIVGGCCCCRCSTYVAGRLTGVGESSRNHLEGEKTMKTATESAVPRAAFTLVGVVDRARHPGALAALVVPGFGLSRRRPTVGNAKSQILLFDGALERYNVDCRDYPSTEDGLDALLRASPPRCARAEMGRALYHRSRMRRPTDPWGEDSSTPIPGTRQRRSPDIWSMGPNRQDDSGA